MATIWLHFFLQNKNCSQEIVESSRRSLRFKVLYKLFRTSPFSFMLFFFLDSRKIRLCTFASSSQLHLMPLQDGGAVSPFLSQRQQVALALRQGQVQRLVEKSPAPLSLGSYFSSKPCRRAAPLPSFCYEKGISILRSLDAKKCRYG